ncbi:hypothetical protein OBBRIDRAFT_808130, partial [Obba rivulosa]
MSHWEPPLLGPLNTERRQSHVAFPMTVPLAMETLFHEHVSETIPAYEEVITNLEDAAALLSVLFNGARIKSEYKSVENLQRLLEKNEELQEELKDSWRRNDFMRLQSFAFWYTASSAPEITKGRARGTVINTEVQTLTVAWTSRYNGVLHKLLCNNIHDAFRHGKRRPFGNFASLINCSGSGKSRMMKQLQELIASIPFNLRRTDSGNMQSYPDPDTMVRDHFMDSSHLSALEQEAFFWTFFVHLFNVISDFIAEWSSHRTYSDLVSSWRVHFRDSHTVIYEEVVTKHQNSLTVSIQRTLPNAALRTEVRGALIRLLKNMDQLVPESARREQSGRVKLVCSFDEADVLALQEVPGNAEEGNLYDALCSSLDVFRGLPIFFVFLSTNSQVALLAPPKSRSKSIAAKQHFGSLVAPFTETPFDCSPKFPLPRDGHTLLDIITVEFMAQLGRPLWGSLLNAMEPEPEPEPEPKSEPPSQGKSTPPVSAPPPATAPPSLQNLNPMAAEMIPLARTKLLSCDALPEFTHETKVEVLSQFYTPLRKRILAEVRVCLNYEPSRQKTYDELAEMVASHMRMVYSVPQHREYMRSGYSSDPILAEAAAQEISVLNTSGIDGATSLPSIIADAMANDLCSVGER